MPKLVLERTKIDNESTEMDPYGVTNDNQPQILAALEWVSIEECIGREMR